jgi:hypothetical protein
MVDVGLWIIGVVASLLDVFPAFVMAMLLAGLSVYGDVMHPAVIFFTGAGFAWLVSVVHPCTPLCFAGQTRH